MSTRDKDGNQIHGFGVNEHGHMVHVSTAIHLGPECCNSIEEFEQETGMTLRQWEDRYNNFLPWSMSSVEELRNHSDWLSDQLDKHEAENTRLQGVLEEVLQWIEGHVVGWHDGPSEVTATGTSAAFEVRRIIRAALEGKE